MLGSDESILGILVTDPDGKHLAYAGKNASENVVLTDEGEIKRIGAMDLLGLRLAPRPEQNSGREEYVAYAYENFKIIVTELKNPSLVIGVKVTRSTNVEYVVNKVLQKYR